MVKVFVTQLYLSGIVDQLVVVEESARLHC